MLGVMTGNVGWGGVGTELPEESGRSPVMSSRCRSRHRSRLEPGHSMLEKDEEG